jgi:hypothetical protein
MMKIARLARTDLFCFCFALLALPCAAADPSAKEQPADGGPVSAAGKIAFSIPHDAHVTIAIDDNAGVRVRNLFADVPFKQGTHAVEWDGRNDKDEKVPAGEYRWKGLFRGDLHAVYQGAFQYGNPPWVYGKTGGWTADHSYAAAVVAVRDAVLIGSTEAEWGHGLIAAALDGHKRWGQRWLNARAWAGADALATVGQRVFATSYPEQNAVWEIDPVNGDNRLVVELKDLPKDKLNTEGRLPGLNGPGLRVVGGRQTGGKDGELYVADLYGKEPRTYVFSTAVAKAGDKFKLLRVLPVRPWSLTWLPDGRCVAAMDKTLDVLDAQTGRTTPLVAKGLEAPYCVVSDPQGRLYVSDQGGFAEIRFNPNAALQQRALRITDRASMQIKVYDGQGRLLRTLGKEGGQQPGKIDPADFWRPAGIALDARGRLWVTEMTYAPKRVSVWNIPDDLAAQAPSVAMQFFGPTTYGGGATMTDPARPWRIMDTNYGVTFDVNLDSGVYRPVEFPWRQYLGRKEHSYRPDLPFDGKPSTVFKIEGREFSFLQGGYEHGAEAHWTPYTGASDACVIGEYRKGVFVPLAAIGNVRMLLRSRELLSRREVQWLPQAILAAAKRRPDWKQLCEKARMDPEMTDAPHVAHDKKSGVWIASPWPKELSGFIWTDANGDGRMQPEEIELATIEDAEGVTFDGRLNAYVFVTRTRGPGIYKLVREGFNAVGAPVYHWAGAKLLDGNRVVQVGDDGSLLDFTSLRGPDGQLRWTYPSNVRGIRDLGSQKWREMLPGAINRIHALRGVVRTPGDLGDVYMLHSTDGMGYLLTRDDGLFIGRIFRPYAYGAGWDTIPQAKRGMYLEDYSLQDECFNGSLVQAQESGQGFIKGHYYLMGLARSAVVELTGLDGVRRLPGGSVKLVEGVGLYAKTVPTPAVPPVLPPGITEAAPARGPIEAPGGAQFQKSVQFADTDVSAAWDRRGLHLKWVVKSSETLFLNKESDWTMLFSTGDVCDLQLRSPKLGRCRYIITMYKEKPVVVRFQYDAQDAGNAVSYKSGVAETRVPVVEKLDLAVNVRRFKDSYAVQLTLPWDVLGIEPKAGGEIPVELGIFRANAAGTKTIMRTYWHSGAVGMVADLPTEAAPTKDWGTLILK